MDSSSFLFEMELPVGLEVDAASLVVRVAPFGLVEDLADDHRAGWGRSRRGGIRGARFSSRPAQGEQPQRAVVVGDTDEAGVLFGGDGHPVESPVVGPLSRRPFDADVAAPAVYSPNDTNSRPPGTKSTSTSEPNRRHARPCPVGKETLAPGFAKCRRGADSGRRRIGPC